MGKLLLKQDEMILLKNSEAVKNIETYGNMYDCVMPYKVLSEIDLQKNELFNTKARATILGNKNLLFQEIKDEWYAIGCNDETTEEVHCQLCGRKNKRIFYIKNRKNKRIKNGRNTGKSKLLLKLQSKTLLTKRMSFE